MGRRLFHLLGGSFFPTLGLFFAPQSLLPYVAGTFLLFLGFDLARWRFPSLNRWRLFSLIALKERESRGLSGSSYLLLSTVAVFGLFGWGVAVASLFFLSLGDPVAAWIGERWGKHRLRGKSLEGSLAFFFAASGVGLGLSPLLGLSPGLLLLGAGVGSALELLPLPGDDNLLISLGAAGAMALAS